MSTLGKCVFNKSETCCFNLKKPTPDDCFKCSQSLYFRTIVATAQIATIAALQSTPKEMDNQLAKISSNLQTKLYG